MMIMIPAVVFQLNEPGLVESLVLINIDPCAKGWMEWAASKVTHYSLAHSLTCSLARLPPGNVS